MIHRHTIRVAGTEIFYRDTGTDGTAILCLHGRWGRGETWYDFLRRYGSGFRVIAPDQRGHGLSGKPVSGYTAEEMASDMTGLLDRLGLERAVWVGHSMGGRVAGYAAALYPERVSALAILDKSASAPDRTGSGTGPAGDPMTGTWPLPFGSLAEAKEHIRRETESDLGYEYFMQSLVETETGYTMMFSREAMAANITHERTWFDLLPAIRCPVLLLRSKGSGAVSDADFLRMRSLLRDCTACEVPDPDHNVYLSDPEVFYRYFDDFLRHAGVEPAGRPA